MAVISKQLEKDKNSFLVQLLAIVVILTNISQIPYLVENNITGYLSNIGWIIVVIVLFLKNKIRFKKFDIKVISLSLLFLFGIMISELLTSNDHLKSNLTNSFYLAIFILLIGSFVSKSFNTETIKMIINYYVFSILIVSLNLFFNVFSEGFNWFSIGYVYGSKNSISQMILIAIILVYYCYSFKNKLLNVARILVLIFWLILLLALKSRATIPFNAILKHGILFGWIPIFMALWPSLWALRNLDKNNSLHLAFTLISLSFLVNSLFEGLAPFGPGAKTYFLWIMFGILYSNRELLTTKYKKIT